jgi:hypothetical protein
VNKTVKVASIEVLPMMCGQITCSHCGHRQSAQAWHHERQRLPLEEYAWRCNACGNPLPEPPGDAP